MKREMEGRERGRGIRAEQAKGNVHACFVET